MPSNKVLKPGLPEPLTLTADQIAEVAGGVAAIVVVTPKPILPVFPRGIIITPIIPVLM